MNSFSGLRSFATLESNKAEVQHAKQNTTRLPDYVEVLCQFCFPPFCTIKFKII